MLADLSLIVGGSWREFLDYLHQSYLQFLCQNQLVRVLVFVPGIWRGLPVVVALDSPAGMGTSFWMDNWKEELVNGGSGGGQSLMVGWLLRLPSPHVCCGQLYFSLYTLRTF